MNWTVFVGTYTQSSAEAAHHTESIFVYRMDRATGQLDRSAAVESGPNPSFLALHPSRRWLYAVNEQQEGQVSAFRVDPASGGLALLNRQSSGGAAPCYASLAPGGRFLLIANYTSGSLSVLPLEEDGRLKPASDLVQHHGSGPDPARQEAAHAHSILPDPSGRWIVSADLGEDRVWVYRLDQTAGRLLPNDPPGLDGKPGAGPRHFAFHPNGRFMYIANELDSTVAACVWEGAAGRITPLQTVSMLPGSFRGENTAADIHLTPSGRFLFVSNRGHDSLAAFAVDPDTGHLTPAGHTSTGGRTPRNFALTPDGRFLLAANQDSDNIVVFRVDDEEGRLEPAGVEVNVPRPVCVVVAEL